MSDPINHHYVPIFYLKQWGDAATGKVIRYYRPYKEVVAKEVAPDNTGFEPHLYSLDGYPPEQRQWIEKYYMGPAVDDPASNALQGLCHKASIPSRAYMAADAASLDKDGCNLSFFVPELEHVGTI